MLRGPLLNSDASLLKENLDPVSALVSFTGNRISSVPYYEEEILTEQLSNALVLTIEWITMLFLIPFILIYSLLLFLFDTWWLLVTLNIFPRIVFVSCIQFGC